MLQACLFLESSPIWTLRERNPFSAEGLCGTPIVPRRRCSNGATESRAARRPHLGVLSFFHRNPQYGKRRRTAPHQEPGKEEKESVAASTRCFRALAGPAPARSGAGPVSFSCSSWRVRFADASRSTAAAHGSACNGRPRYDRGFSQREVYMITTSLVLLFVVLVAFMFFLNR